MRIIETLLYCENQRESMGNVENGTAHWMDTAGFSSFHRKIQFSEYENYTNLLRQSESWNPIQLRFYRLLKMGIHNSLKLALIFAVFWYDTSTATFPICLWRLRHFGISIHLCFARKMKTETIVDIIGVTIQRRLINSAIFSRFAMDRRFLHKIFRLVAASQEQSQEPSISWFPSSPLRF